MPDIEVATGLPIGVAVDAAPALPPQRVRLAGRLVALEPLDAAVHAASLYALSQADAALWTYMPEGPFADAAAFHGYVAAKAQSADPLFFAIIELASGRAVGHASFLRIDPKNRVIEVGFILYTSALQRTPGATEAMYLMAAHVFEALGYRRYEWKCNDLNAPSLRAAVRLGFIFEGIFRQAVIVKGRNRDTAWFSMLDSEWPARKAAFEAWLAPENFDIGGRQKQPLNGGRPLPGGRQKIAFRAGAALRRAQSGDRAGIEAMQARAYQRNAIVTACVPTPLQWDYDMIIAAREVWLLDGAAGPDAALVLRAGETDVAIDSISVSPDAQGTGLGSILMDFVHQRARSLGRTTLRLIVNQKMAHNIAWYQRQGFVVEKLEAVVDRTIVHMAKQI